MGEAGFGRSQWQLAAGGVINLVIGIGIGAPISQRHLARMAEHEQPAGSSWELITRLLPVAIWFGLLAGLIEGGIFLAFLHFRIARLLSVWIDVVWISPLVNAFLFAVFALVVIAISRIQRGLPITLLSVVLFTFLALVDWIILVLTDRGVHLAAASLLALGLTVTFARWFYNRQDVVLVFCRRTLPILGAIAVAILVGVQGGTWIKESRTTSGLPPAPPNAPNVLVILVDTLRADHLSSYGYERTTSPNMDRIAKEGVLFEKPFSSAPWTTPSHASLLTGLYPSEIGLYQEVGGTKKVLPSPTLPEAMMTQGYRTAAFSANTSLFTRENGFGGGFIHFEDYFFNIGDSITRTFYGRRIASYIERHLLEEEMIFRKRSEDVNRSVLDWVQRDEDAPFFVFINYFDTHGPFLPKEPFRSKFSNSGKVGGRIGGQQGGQTKLTPKQMQGEIDAYDGAIAYVDHHIGELLAEFSALGLEDDLLVVITSDHGEAFGEHGFVTHANTVYREEIFVPLIFWQPGSLPSGVRVSQPVTNAYLPATIMDMVADTDQSLFPGLPLADLWEAPDVDRDDWPFPLSELGPDKSLVNQEWHFILNENEEAELYQWSNDPKELQNFAESNDSIDITTLFRETLETILPGQK